MWSKLFGARRSAAAATDVEVDRWGEGRFFERQVGTRLVKVIASDVYARNEILRRAGALEYAQTQYQASDGFSDIGSYEGVGARLRPSDDEIDRVLADCRPPALTKELAAIAASIPRDRRELTTFLAERARELNAVAPQTTSPRAFDELNGQIRGLGSWAQWVDPQLVVSTNQPVWNRFDRRPGSVPDIAAGLAAAVDTTEGIERWLYRMFAETGCIGLLRIEGPAGPIYEVCGDGTHRVHAARLLGVPAILAVIEVSALPRPRGESGLVEARWRDLRDRGVIEAEVLQGRWFFRGVTAEWLLKDASTAEAVSAAYERCYPGALAQMSKPRQTPIAGS